MQARTVGGIIGKIKGKNMSEQTKLTFEDACSLVMQHLRARNWDKSNSTKGIAISLSLEANELLEYFQWHDEPIGNVQDLASELADIFIYAIQFAEKYSIDIPLEIKKKLEKQEKKYPIELFENKDETERREAWLKAKKDYKKDTTL